MLAIWVLRRDSFQNSRGTVLAIECLERIFKKKLWGTALAIWDLGRVSFQSKLRDTVLAIWYLGRVWGPRPTPQTFRHTEI